MTQTSRPQATSLHALSLRALRLAEATPAGRALLDGLLVDPDRALVGPALLGAGSPSLAALLQAVAAGSDRWRRWGVASRVARFGDTGSAGTGGDAGAVRTAALVVLLGPELGIARRRLLGAGLDHDLADSELAAALVEALGALPPGVPQGGEAAWLVRRVDVAVRRAGRAWRREAERTVPLGEDDDWACEDDDPALVVSTLLVEATAAKALSVRQASLLHAVRIADEAPAEVARARGRTARALRVDLARAEVALRTYLSGSLCAGGSAAPVGPAGSVRRGVGR